MAKALGDDRQVRKRIVEFLRRHHFPRLNRLRFEVRNGVVTVEGNVQSLRERMVCIACCRCIDGVDQIVDRIQVSRCPVDNKLRRSRVES
ncbi:MAG: BON domain-containing protein [Pirellulales bacterium]|nr:BON domain-containing protein [Pirellulales bacterium]